MAFLIGGDGSPAANTLLSSSIPSTDNAVARYDGITGLLIEDSGVTISDADAVIIPGGGSLTVAALSGVLQASAGLISGGADSDDVPEGAANFYYTEARFDSSFSGKSTTDLSEGTNLYYTQARFDTAFGVKDTDDLSEGITNLYYTEVRVSANTDVAANTAVRHTHVNLTELDLITDGDHDVRTDNPHSATFTQVVAVDAGTDITTAEAETLTDGSNADALHVHAGGAVPGGADTQVQFNDVGAFGGDAGLTYNKTTDTLTIGGDLNVDTTAKQILASDAGVSAPAYSYAGDPDTGIFNSAANQLSFTVGGVNQMDISGTRVTLQNILRFSPDNIHDIGAAGDTRPKDYHGAGKVILAANLQLESSGSDALLSKSLGAGTKLTLGATTSSISGSPNFNIDVTATSGLEQRCQNFSTGASALVELRLITSSTAANTVLSFSDSSLGAEWAEGLDQSDSDAFVIGASRTLGTNRALRIDATTRDIVIDNDLEIDGDLNHDGSNVGFFATAPVAQEADTVALTDSTTGTANDTVVAVPVIGGSGATTAQEDAINDNFADLTAKYNALRDLLRAYGLMV